MSQTEPDDAVRLEAAASASLEAQALRSLYLDALATLTPYHAHELRGRLGTAALHLDLAGELLGRDPAATPAVSQPAEKRALGELNRARDLLRDVSQALESMLGLTRAAAAARAFDLRDLVREIERALAPAARARRIVLRTGLPGVAVTVERDRDPLRQALVVAGVTLIEAMAAGGTLELVLAATDDQATITLAAPPADAPAAGPSLDTSAPIGIVRAALESNRCTTRAEGTARLILILPLTSRSDP